MKHLLTFVLAAFCSLAAVADTLVSPPVGGEAVTYYLMGYSFRSSENISYEIKVLRDGDDIYLQGLYRELPEAWVKGTMRGNTAVFPSGQYMGEVDPSLVDDSHETFDVYMFCSMNMNTTRDLEIEYNPLNDTFEAYFQYILFSEKDDIRMRYEHLQNVSFFSGKKDLVVPPAGMEVRPYTMTAYECSLGKDLEYQVKLGFDGDNVYVQGFSQEFPESWVVGTLSEGRLSFMRNQYLGVYKKLARDYDIWLTGINHDDAYFTSVIFNYDKERGFFTQIEGNWLVVNGDPAAWKWLNNMSEICLYPDVEEQEIDHFALITPPADVQTVPFVVTAHDYSFGAPEDVDSYEVQMAFTEDGVYIKGIYTEMPEAWVRGSFDGETLVLPAMQYLGKWYNSIDCWLTASEDEVIADVVLKYDATIGGFVLTKGQYIYFNDKFDEVSPMALNILGDVVLTGELPEGIRSTTVVAPATTSVYDLWGRCSSSAAAKGVLIRNGKKVVL